MAENTNTSTPKGKFPSSIPYIVGNEAAERFNYYGMTAILTTFLIHQFYNPTNDPALEQVANATANAKNHDFKAMVYLLPMFGGMIADWFWGKYKTIMRLSLVYAFGSAMVALSVDNEFLFTTSLMFIAMGAGGIKPCVSANVGDQFDSSNSHLISKAFDAFYFSINAGSMLSILLIPYLNKHYGPMVAFGVPAIAMLIAVFFFWLGRSKYRRIPPPKFDPNKLVIFLTAFVSLVASYLYWDTIPTLIKQTVERGGTSSLAALYPFWDAKEISTSGTGTVLIWWLVLVVILTFIFKKQWFAKPGNFVGINFFALTNGGFSAAAKEYGDETVEGIKSVWRVLSVFIFVPVFWALWDQSQSEWVVQATRMDLKWLGINWQAEQISFVNAAFILAFIPLFSFGVYPLLNMIGIKVTPLRKIGAGLVLTGLSFVLISMIQGWIDPQMAGINAFMDTMNALPETDKANMVQQWMSANPGSTIDFKKLLETDLLQNYLRENGGINISWQILAFVILTAGEVLISITCLEYAYTQSPPSMKSTIMACYLLSVTLGNVLVSVIQTNIKNGGFFAQFHGAGFFWLFTGICFATAVIFMFVSPFIKERSYIVSDND